MTIATLQAMPIIGNAHHDRPRFDAANEIILDPERPMSERIAALREIDRTMGEPDTIIDGLDVLIYLIENGG